MIRDFIRRIAFKVNPKYKDRVFCFIFGDTRFRNNALSLYNAVNGTDYTNVDDLVIYTLEDALYMKMKNDVAYLFQDTIALYEQQSTVNPNMPIRGLAYMSEMYSKYITMGGYNVYGTGLIKLPNPQYVVFYNGAVEYTGPEKLRLSDAFIKPDTSGEFEWTATVVDLNKGDNPIRQGCPVLNEYMLFVETIRGYRQSMSLEAALEKAIKECIDNNILKDVLIQFQSEVRKMFITEFDEKAFIKSIRAESYEEAKREYEAKLESQAAKLESQAAEIESLKAIITDLKRSDLQ